MKEKQTTSKAFKAKKPTKNQLPHVSNKKVDLKKVQSRIYELVKKGYDFGIASEYDTMSLDFLFQSDVTESIDDVTYYVEMNEDDHIVQKKCDHFDVDLENLTSLFQTSTNSDFEEVAPCLVDYRMFSPEQMYRHLPSFSLLNKRTPHINSIALDICLQNKRIREVVNNIKLKLKDSNTLEGCVLPLQKPFFENRHDIKRDYQIIYEIFHQSKNKLLNILEKKNQLKTVSSEKIRINDSAEHQLFLSARNEILDLRMTLNIDLIGEIVQKYSVICNNGHLARTNVVDETKEERKTRLEDLKSYVDFPFAELDLELCSVIVPKLEQYFLVAIRFFQRFNFLRKDPIHLELESKCRKAFILFRKLTAFLSSEISFDNSIEELFRTFSHETINGSSSMSIPYGSKSFFENFPAYTPLGKQYGKFNGDEIRTTMVSNCCVQVSLPFQVLILDCLMETYKILMSEGMNSDDIPNKKLRYISQELLKEIVFLGCEGVMYGVDFGRVIGHCFSNQLLHPFFWTYASLRYYGYNFSVIQK